MHARVLRSCLALILANLSFAGSPAAAAEPIYDLVIRGGSIVDGSGNPWFRGDVGVRGDRIAAIGRIPAGAGRREIDAAGLIVAPGFIDIHSHSDLLLLEEGQAQSKLRQGVTTEVLGESDSAGPSVGRLPSRKLAARGKTVEWRTLGDYYDLLDREGVAVNVASYVGLGTLWRCVMGDSFERPSDEERERMRELLRQALDEGAWGLSSMLAMPPGSLATTDDVVELCREVGRAGGIYSSHIRNEGTGVFAAVREAIEIGERAGVPVDIIHLKIADQQYWGRMSELVALIDAAERGASTCRRTSIPTPGATTTSRASFPPGRTKGARPDSWNACAIPSSGCASSARSARGCRAGTTTTRRSAGTGAGC